jgi:hypothetical protein
MIAVLVSLVSLSVMHRFSFFSLRPISYRYLLVDYALAQSIAQHVAVFRAAMCSKLFALGDHEEID